MREKHELCMRCLGHKLVTRHNGLHFAHYPCPRCKGKGLVYFKLQGDPSKMADLEHMIREKRNAR